MWTQSGRRLVGLLIVGLLGAGNAARCADNLVFVPLAPCRVVDTRLPGTPLAAGVSRTFIFRGPTLNYRNPAPFPDQGGSTSGCGIPDFGELGGATRQNVAQALAINVIAVGPKGAGDIRAWAAGQAMPAASILNYAVVPGLNIANGVIVPMCPETAIAPCALGDITFLADVSAAHLVVDVVGYFHAGSTATFENTALGHGALGSNTTGFGNTAVGRNALAANTEGFTNTATGASALAQTTTGIRNTATGAGTLLSNTSGSYNTAVGVQALRNNTSGKYNSAFGEVSLYSNTVGRGNSAIGRGSLGANVSGNGNIGIGSWTLSGATGNQNIAIGYSAGANLTGGSSNIVIANAGNAGESATIRIGGPNQTRAFIAGIRGKTTGHNDAVGVLIDSDGQLGTVSSSVRFKEDIHDLGAVADRLLALRPVSFRYKQPFADGEKPVQYGLIAEETEKVFPELVAYDRDGKPETIKYHLLVPLLVGEVKNERDGLVAMERRAAEQDALIRQLLLRVSALEGRCGVGPPQ